MQSCDSASTRIIATIVCACLTTLFVRGDDLRGEAARLQSAPEQDNGVPVHSTSDTKHDVTLTVECPKVMYSGQENLVTFVIRNHSNRTMLLGRHDPNSRWPAFRVEVTRFGAPVQLTELGSQHFKPSELLGAGEPLRLKKEEEIRIVMNLTRYFDLSRPADVYQIDVTALPRSASSVKFFAIRPKALDFELKVKPGESIARPE